MGALLSLPLGLEDEELKEEPELNSRTGIKPGARFRHGTVVIPGAGVQLGTAVRPRTRTRAGQRPGARARLWTGAEATFGSRLITGSVTRPGGGLPHRAQTGSEPEPRLEFRPGLESGLSSRAGTGAEMGVGLAAGDEAGVGAGLRAEGGYEGVARPETGEASSLASGASTGIRLVAGGEAGLSGGARLKVRVGHGAGAGRGRARDRGRRPYTRRVFRNRTSYLNLSEEQCVQRLGFSREAVSELCHLVQEQLQPRTRAWTALPVAVKVTVALNFYTTGSFQAASGLTNDITQYAIHCCIRDVTEVLYSKRNQFISFPMETESQAERALGFRAIADFPQVQGVLGCAHVALRAPYDHPGVYVNKKGFHSLKVQLVCDHQKRVMQVCSRFPGSAWHSAILEQSSVPPLFRPERQALGWLLGGSGYPLDTWLMTPVRKPRTPCQHHYNQSHAATLATVPQTIVLLKHRFRCLSKSGGTLQYSPERVSKFIVVCCMLHNFALQRGQGLEEPGEGEVWDEEEEEESSPNLTAATALQQQIIAETFS
ncbi:putative nuclease HARBI1 [Scyliorhinus torazame]|uniref:putative nuclease HARBI1 n=1 Tax=Scyliorhinus torazame TaxID=75743 RepID=UPI003B5BCF58